MMACDGADVERRVPTRRRRRRGETGRGRSEDEDEKETDAATSLPGSFSGRMEGKKAKERPGRAERTGKGRALESFPFPRPFVSTWDK